MWKPRVYIWLEVVINFLYFICLSPYRFKFNESTDSYECVSSVFHTLLVAAAHICGTLQTGMGLYVKTATLQLTNPKCFFHSVVGYTRYIVYYSAILTFWIKRSHFIAFFNSYIPPYEKPKDNRKALIVAWIMCILTVPAAISIELYGFNEVYGLSGHTFLSFVLQRSPSHFLNAFGVNSNVNGILPPPPSEIPFGVSQAGLPPILPTLPAPSVSEFLSGENASIMVTLSLPDKPPPLPPQIPIGEIILSVIYNIVILYVRVCNHVVLLYCIFAAVTLHQAATTCMTSMMAKRSQELVIQEYVEFCQFGKLLNCVCGYVILISVICSPAFFIVYLIDILNSSSMSGPRIIYYTIYSCILYGFASSAASKVGDLKEWILENGEGENECQFFALFVEVSNNPMGLRGMNCFTITYGFVSKILGMIITFTIIILQFETTPKNSIIDSTCTV